MTRHHVKKHDSWARCSSHHAQLAIGKNMPTTAEKYTSHEDQVCQALNSGKMPSRTVATATYSIVCHCTTECQRIKTEEREDLGKLSSEDPKFILNSINEDITTAAALEIKFLKQQEDPPVVESTDQVAFNVLYMQLSNK